MHRVLGRLVVGVMGVFCLSGLAVAAADPATAPSTPLDPSAASVAIELQRSARQLDAVTHAFAAAESDLSTAETALALTRDQLAQNQRMLDDVETRIRQRAALAYVRHGAVSAAPLAVEQAQDAQTAQRYGQAAISVDVSDIEGLKRTEDLLQRALDERGSVRDQAASKRDDLARRRDTLTAEADRDRKQLALWGAVPVMGESTLSAEQLAAWYSSTGVVPQLPPGTTMADIARYYIEEGDAEGVRGDLAFAQAIIETGSFTVAAGNNFSGIGVCDSCTGGYAFATPRDGVRAQIQLLRNYADPDSRADRLAYPPSPVLYGTDPDKAAKTYDSFFLKGKAPLWNLMGGGNWATDPSYAAKVDSQYLQIVAYAASHP